MHTRIVVSLVVTALAACSGDPAPSGAASELAASPAANTGLRLSEIRILPAESMPTFIEIANVGDTPVGLDAAQLAFEGGATTALPSGLTLEPNATFAVSFDDAGGVDAGGAHFPAADFSGSATGRVELRTQGNVADAIGWGRLEPGSVSLCRGGRCGAPAAGEVIVRVPGAKAPFDAAAWAPLDAELASPGAANPRPPVSAFAALPGMIFAAAPHFSWYSVAGATRYQLEVARGADFAALVYEADVESTPGMRLEQLTVQGPELPPGDYAWRVRALGATGEAAEESVSVPFSVDPSAAVTAPVDTTATPAADGSPAPPQPNPDGVLKVLDVPIIEHAKDTSMLTLEAETEARWDRPNVAGYPYCARAGVAMINAYYGGKLSQDRIGYEVFKNLRDGPEYDLPVVGIEDPDTDRYSLPLAIGTRGSYVSNVDHAYGEDRRACLDYVMSQALAACAAVCADQRSPECFQCRLAREREISCPTEIAYRWGRAAIEDIQREIDAGRPMIATNSAHLFLIVGYRVRDGRFSFFYQDEGGRQEFPANPSGLTQNLVSYWTGLAAATVSNDEPEVNLDSDDDGVVDFDETRRFGTDPERGDSDGDDVPDKREIHASVWDAEHGYHRTVTTLDATAPTFVVEQRAASANLTGRDFDRDGVAMELDPDSDAGGCRDGDEDFDYDGARDGGETYNFDPEDDNCDVALGGRITMRYGFVPSLTPPCTGNVSVRLKFALEPDWDGVPEQQRTLVASSYQARRFDYEIRTEGCKDIVGGGFDFWDNANVACNAPAGAKSGVAAMDEGSLGAIVYLPLMPQLSVTLPPDVLLDISSQCIYADGRTADLSVTGIGGEFLQIGSGASCTTRDRYVYGQPPNLLSFCVEPTVCNSPDADPNVLVDCFTKPESHAVLPFAGTLYKLGGIVDGYDINSAPFPIEIEPAEVRYEICRGCGDEFL